MPDAESGATENVFPKRSLICRLIGHRFDGWNKQKGFAPGKPLPWARCGRCGRVL